MADAYYLERTVVPSNLVLFYFNSFNVRIKRNDNLKRYEDYHFSDFKHNRILTPATWTDLTLEKSDSMGQFNDDDDESDFESLLNVTTTSKQADDIKISEEDEDEDSQLVPVNVFIGPTSMKIDNREPFLFHSTVLSACVIHGVEKSRNEDSLLIGLQSGKVLLMRIALINGFFEPLILQIISLSRDYSEDKQLQLGYKVSSFPLGNLVSVSAFANIIRLSRVNYDKNGVPSLSNSVNMITHGVIIHNCFFEPINTKHIALLNLINTPSNILQLEYNEFYLENTFESTHKKVKTLLPNNFELPHYMVPLKQTTCVLLIQESMCLIMGLSYMLSNEGLDHQKCEFPLEKQPYQVISYYLPKKQILCSSSPEYDDPDIRIDQILISTSYPSVLLLEVFMNIRKPEWNMRIRKLFTQPTVFSQFSLELVDDDESEYELNYMNGKGQMDFKQIKLSPKSKDKFGFVMKVVEDKGSQINWFPNFDYTVVNSSRPKFVNNCSTQELWCASRCDKKGSLMNIRRGYTAEKSTPVSAYKSVLDLFKYECANGKILFILSYPNESKVVTIEDSVLSDSNTDHTSDAEIDEETLSELQFLHANSSTLLVSTLPNESFLQVLENSWRIVAIGDEAYITEFDFPYKIILAAYESRYLVVVYENILNKTVTTEIQVYHFTPDFTNITLLNTQEPFLSLNSEISMISLDLINDRPVLFIGRYDNTLDLYVIDELTVTQISTININELLFENESFDTPHHLATSICDNQLIIGSKDGCLLNIPFNFNSLTCLKTKTISLKLGELPLKIAKTGDSQFYLIAKALWKVDLKRSLFPKRVWVNETTDRSCNSVVLFPRITDEITGEVLDDQLVAIRDDGLCNLFVSQYVGSSVKKINLDATPLKLFYYEHYDLFIVIPKIEKSSDSFKLLFVDHKTKKKSKIENPTPVLKPDEYPISFSAWQVQSRRANYKHNHLLVGCIDQSNGSGSVLILELKKSKKDVTVKLLTSWVEELPPHAIAQLFDSTIVYSQGSSLFSRKYLSSEGKMGDSVHVSSLPSDVKGINVISEKTVIVTTARDSFFVLEYKENKLNLISHDMVSRSLLSNCLIDFVDSGEGILTVADKNHFTITSISVAAKSVIPHSHSTVARVKIPFIPRIQSCTFDPLWTKTTSSGFLAVGVNGEIRAYERITKDQSKMIIKYMEKKNKSDKKKKHYLKLSEISSFAMDQVNLLNFEANVINVDSIYDKGDSSDILLDQLLHSFFF